MEHDRGRDFRKKKFNVKEREEKQIKILQKAKESSKLEDGSVPQTILLKTREGVKRAVSPQPTSSAKPGKDGGVYLLAPKAPDLSSLLPNVPEMKSCVKLINPDTLTLSEAVLEYLTDSTDFLVIGCLGYQGVGKSTVLSKIASLESGEFVFPTGDETGGGGGLTEGLDVFVTRDRLILVDVEPLLAPAPSSGAATSAGGAAGGGGSTASSCPPRSTSSCLLSEEEQENEIEILSLQYAALLMTVCHILIVVQDCTFDPDLVRFLQAAEMLKPSSQPLPEDPGYDYFPYMILLHNKVAANLFTRQKIKDIQEAYRVSFSGSQLPVSSGIGIASGTILRSLNPQLCGESMNLFLLPHYSLAEDQSGFNWNLQYNELMYKMTLQLLSLPPLPLTHPILTEKNWWHYIHKIWEDIKKSTFFPEYGRLLPSHSLAKAELGNT